MLTFFMKRALIQLNAHCVAQTSHQRKGHAIFMHLSQRSNDPLSVRRFDLLMYDNNSITNDAFKNA